MSVGWSVFGIIMAAVFSGGTAMLVNYFKDRSSERAWDRDEVLKGYKERLVSQQAQARALLETTVQTYQLQLEHAVQEEQEAISRAERAEDRAERIETRAQARISEAERVAESRKRAYDELRSEVHSERTVWRNQQAKWTETQLRWERERGEFADRVEDVEKSMVELRTLMYRCLQTCEHAGTCELLGSPVLPPPNEA